MDQGAPRSGGLLAQARSLPTGWERGISWADTSCTQPVVMGECPTAPDLKPAQQVVTETFRPVELIQSIECTTLGGGPNNLAGPALDQTRDYALAREMLTGEASARDASIPDHANPALVDVAFDLGNEFPTLAEALSCMEARLANNIFGRQGFILAGPEAATWLLSKRLMWRDGGTWRTGYGSIVIVDAGFDGRQPGTTQMPQFSQPVYLYGVGNVWAGVGQRTVLSDVNRADNTATERSEDIALAAFTTCAAYGAASPEAVSCG